MKRTFCVSQFWLWAIFVMGITVGILIQAVMVYCAWLAWLSLLFYCIAFSLLMGGWVYANREYARLSESLRKSENENKDALNAIDKEYNYKLEQAKGNATIEGREEGIKIASRQGIRDAEKARSNRTYYDANGRPYKITANGREYVKQEIKGNPDDEGATPPKGQEIGRAHV